MRRVPARYMRTEAPNVRLNQPKKPVEGSTSLPASCLSRVAHKAGVSVSAISAEKAIVSTSVTANWR